MRKGKLRKREWALYESVLQEQVALRDDWPRRLRNALAALAEMDPGWICWVERNVPLNLTIRQITRLIERQARVLVCRSHHFPKSVWLWVVYSDRYFSERGLVS